MTKSQTRLDIGAWSLGFNFIMPKKPQLRRCGECNSVGHNRATCPKKLTSNSPNNSAGMVNFFIHHVNTPDEASPHVVNLKTTRSDLWSNVKSSAPEALSDSLFHTYHVREEKIGRQTPPNLPLERGGSEMATTPSKLFSDLEYPKTNTKHKHFALASRFNDDSLKTFRTFALLAIVSIGFIAVVPNSARSYYENISFTKTSIIEDSTAGFLALQESVTALRSADLPSAEAATSEALNRFNLALGNLTGNHTVLQTIAGMVPFVHGELLSREKVLLAGGEIALGNSYLIGTLKSFAEGPSSTLTHKLDQLTLSLGAANPNYERALANLDAVDIKSLPLEYQEQFKDYRSLFTNLVKNFKNIANLNDTLQEIFGGRGQRRYLVIFQNPAELRPTGGFMGSFAVLDVRDGEILNFTVPAGGTYDLDGQLITSEIPPLPLTIVNKRWEFQDANWFPDFAASAKKILWFYKQSWNETADGVIAVNASVLERILGVIGPITDTGRNLNLSAENATVIIQNEVENGPEKLQNKPKQILADLAPTILDSIRNAEPKNLLPLLGNLNEALSQKELQAYFVDSAAEDIISSSGWGGRISKIDPNSDYLLVVNTNLQGQKSDARIKQLISHEATIENDGTIIDNVVITREHTGLGSEKFYGAPNIDYLRVYVPEGSTLLSASGFTWPEEKSFRAPDPSATMDPFLKNQEIQLGIDQASGTRITSEFGKTAFGNWVITEPGAISQVQFSYRLPFRINLETSGGSSIFDKLTDDLQTNLTPYRLITQKQSGITSDFESQIIFPLLWQPSWLRGAHATPARNGFKIETFPLTNDEAWSVLLKKNI